MTPENERPTAALIGALELIKSASKDLRGDTSDWPVEALDVADKLDAATALLTTVKETTP
jgi:hypothetical protein